jgi:hypothetical protein
MTDTEIDLSTDPNGASNDKIPVATATAIPYTDGCPVADTTHTIPSNQQEPPPQPVIRSSLITSFSTSNVMTGEALQTLRDQGFPMGLAQELGNTKATYPLRFWIVDNSGYVIPCITSMSSTFHLLELLIDFSLTTTVLYFSYLGKLVFILFFNFSFFIISGP